jgi:hypothetical protein
MMPVETGFNKRGHLNHISAEPPSGRGAEGITPGNFLKFYVRIGDLVRVGAFWRQFFCS